MPFEYANGVLSLRRESRVVPLTDVAKGQSTPLYVYDREDVLTRVAWYRSAFARPVKIHFALKANPYLPLLQNLATQKVGADVVSGGELTRALEAGVPPEMIVFSGVGKSSEELKQAIDCRIGQINVESLPELSRLAQLSQNVKSPIRVALRLNPDVTPDTHHHITTGSKENKFGLDAVQLPDAIEILRTHDQQLQFYGLAMHVGSQIIQAAPMVEAVTRLKTMFEHLRREGWTLQSLDIGGGLGIDYSQNDILGDHLRLKSYAQSVEAVLSGLDCDLLVEPGRFLVARAGALLTQVEYVKRTPHRNFVIVNSGMNHLMRPALYQAEHRIVPLVQGKGLKEIVCDVVGPICESTDVLGRNRKMSEPQAGDWLAVLDTGAYGYSMANHYNLRALPNQTLI